MKWRFAAMACALALLAACSTQRPRPTPPLSRPNRPVVAPKPVLPPVATPLPMTRTWRQLRARFAMHDCVPAAVRRARRETRNRKGFEQHLQRLLPLIAYVQQVAAQHHVAGEFALLPWVESHFRQTPPRAKRPAGMWQIMAITARSLNLTMSRRYDARLDPIASTEAVMKLLSRYHRQWHDWRLADMAFNTGEYRLRRILKKHGKPPARPVIPDLPVGKTTRNHVTRLLAIACIIREPQRFHIHLPALAPGQSLEAVTLPEPTTLAQVARATRVPRTQLRRLNAGYRRGLIPKASPMHILIPASAVTRLDQAIAAGELHSGNSHASGGSRYTVVSGDSLWSIARRFGLAVKQLRRWNHLHTSTLQPGQVLTLKPLH